MNTKKLCIIVLAGSIVKNDDGSWRTTTFDERDHTAILGDRLRIVAATELYHENPDCMFIVSGGQHWEDTPTFSSVLKKELVELGGVPEEKIIEEDASHGTYRQLLNCIPIIEREGFTRVGVLSNRYHLPRIAAMIKHNLALETLRESELLSAEEILLAANPHELREEIETAYASAAMQERIALEQKGIQQIENGTYTYR